MSVEIDIITRIFEIIKDSDAIMANVGTNNYWILCRERRSSRPWIQRPRTWTINRYIIKLTRNAINVQEYTEHHTPLCMNVPLSDPKCFEKVAKAVKEINRWPRRVRP